MSQAFCQQCGTRRENDASERCPSCGAPFPGQQAMPNLPEDEAPTRIAGQAPRSPGQRPGPTPPAGPAQNMPAQNYAAQQPPVPQQGWQQPGYGQQPPGMQQWGSPPGQQPGKSGNAKLWILIAAVVLVIGGGIATALILTGGSDGGGSGGKDSASDAEQIEKVVDDYSATFERLMSGDATACDDLADLSAEPVDDTEMQTCRDGVTSGPDAPDFELKIKFKDVTVNGDTAVAKVETSSTFGGSEPTSSVEDLPMRKVDGEWKIDFDAETGSSGGSSDEPSYGSSEPSYGTTE